MPKIYDNSKKKLNEKQKKTSRKISLSKMTISEEPLSKKNKIETIKPLMNISSIKNKLKK